MIWKALVKSFDSFLIFLDCPEVQSESDAIAEQWNTTSLYHFINSCWCQFKYKIILFKRQPMVFSDFDRYFNLILQSCTTYIIVAGTTWHHQKAIRPGFSFSFFSASQNFSYERNWRKICQENCKNFHWWMTKLTKTPILSNSYCYIFLYLYLQLLSFYLNLSL